ncbi:type ISP restriction/modification enzyme [Catalinimonas niigatensis]|uniref:type ISP restriction/modification enzyme n=1 Tax=Catalinimonas niigatensis TaxID=1397264 RepID=UPI0026662975|nr:type ISP restriction/modification enzyme [Catalinimonas niigatensis]WPP51567.1 type ISP restriction/modification enzyme [Catalinimonas niigatensis]
MPLAKKILSFLHHLQSAHAPDEVSVQNLTHYLPLWTEQYKKTYLALFEQIKKEKAKSRSLKASVSGFSEELRIRLSDQLPENDLLKILTEALLLSCILKENEWQSLVDHTHLSSLAAVIQQLKTPGENTSLDTLQEISKEIAVYLPDEIQKPVWQYLHHSQQHNTSYSILTTKAGAQLISFSNYLLKRKIGLSLNDQDLQILWLNTAENHWEQNLLSQLEPDLQQKAFAERILSCQINLFNFGLAYQEYLQQNQATAEQKAQLYWQDPLNVLGQGIQTNLFSSVNEKSTISDKLQKNTFSFIGLDIRQAHHPYRYARRSMQSTDQQILNAYQSLGIQDISIGQRERLLYWSMEKLGEQGMIMAILPRNILEENESRSFRHYLAQTFQEIYVLDLEEQEAGLAVLYLVKKSVSRPERQANIQYIHLALNELHDESNKDFEALKWQKVKPDQQDYWIGLPDSDFFDMYPIFGTTQSIFKHKAGGLKSFLDEWLIEDDAKLLEKKVKYLLKQYAKEAQKEDNTPDIKWPETLRKMAQSGMTLSYDKQKIKKIQLKPFVFAFIYAEEKLLLHSDNLLPSIGYDSSSKQAFPLNLPWHSQLFDHFSVFPLKPHTAQGKAEENISDAALAHFQTHYKLRTKNLDQTFIVFPPENISTTLDKIESVSRDLPVIRKYPNQINRLLEEARHFTSDVELLTPPYEKIDEFKRKVLRLEKDAIERKVIYQRVKTYIEELKEQLATLTREHDDAKKDYEAVSKESIFYYTYAVLHDPNYRQKYQAFLRRELPHIPLLPKFRQWVQWGKAIFQAHQVNAESERLSAQIQMKEEKHEKQLSKTFTYDLDEERSTIELNEQTIQITLSNIPKTAWNYQFAGGSPLMHYLDYLSKKISRNKKVKEQFTQTHLSDKAQIIANLRHLCSLSIQLAAIENEMQKAHF